MPWEAFSDPEWDPCIWKMVMGNESWESDMCCGVSVVRAGCALALHHHRSPEVYCFLEGNGRMQIGQHQIDTEPGNMYYIGGNVHHMTMASEEEDLIFAFFFPYNPFDEIEY